MLEPENHEGLIAFLIGLIALVLLAVGATMLIDGSSGSAKARKELMADIAWQVEEIHRLKMAIESKSARILASERRTAAITEEISEVESAIGAASGRIERAGEIAVGLRRTIAMLEDDGRLERARIRKWLATHVVGESLGNLSLRNGEVFLSSKIAGIEPYGLVIRHAGGSAFVAEAELPDELRARFPWDAPTSPTSPAAIDPGKNPAMAAPVARPLGPVPDEARLTAARNSLRRAGERLERIDAEHRRIAMLARSSTSRSAHGSLETWPEKLAALGRELAAARTQYAKARAELVILAPEDPLLMVWRLH